MAPPGLMDDLIGEILLRVPPEDPECLVRASFVCKPWRRLLSYPSFPGHYREFHGSPPLLGFLYNEYHRAGGFFPRFIPVKEASPITITNPQKEHDFWTIDCHHGRMLLINKKLSLIIWDPITYSQQNIGKPKIEGSIHSGNVVVLCTVDGCDHLSCHGGPSLLVLLYIDIPNEQGATKTGTWNASVSSVHLGPALYGCRKMIGSSMLVQDTLYFILEEGRRILKYDMVGCRLSVMSPPPLPMGNMVLMKVESGGLAACGLEGHSLNLWAWWTGPGGIWEWKQGRVIQLDIGDLSTKLDVADFAEGAGSIFVRTHNGNFPVELKYGRARKIGKGGNFKDVFPFMSFYTPGNMLPPDCRRQ